MEFLRDNFSTIVAIIALGLVVVMWFRRFLELSPEEQNAKVREWLLYAVTIAEKDLGGGTGKLKLRQTYDMFLTKFPTLAEVMTFARFSGLVDEALEEMKRLINENQRVADFVAGEASDE